VKDAIQDLLYKQAIESVLILYAQACDTRDWSLLDQVFHPEIAVNYGGEFKLDGRSQVVAMIQSMLGGCGPTQHLLGNFTINVDGNQAQCHCYVRAAHAGAEDKSELFYEVWAEYKDHLILRNGRWQIDQREMVVHKEIGTREILSPKQ
jgi:hypothetical protein